MSITRSIGTAQTDNRVGSKSELLCRLLLLLKPCETGASLFNRTYEASEIHERHTFEARWKAVISVTRSISVAQIDNGFETR